MISEKVIYGPTKKATGATLVIIEEFHSVMLVVRCMDL